MSFESVYEMFTSLDNARVDQSGQRFWDWFDGDDLRNWWNLNNITGVGSAVMDDTIDGGAIITAGTNINDTSAIDFLNKRQYNFVDSVVIGVVKRNTAGGTILSGFANNPFTALNRVGLDDNPNNTFKQINSGDNSASSGVDTDIPVDTNFTSFKLELKSSGITPTVNGVVQTEKTTNLPTLKLQPFQRTFNLSGGTQSTNIRYLEAFNT